MPITKSAIKALRQNHTKHSRNTHFMALYRESVKTFERALKANCTRTESDELLSKVYSNIDKLVKKNIIHTNNGARKKSFFANFAKKKILSANA